MQREVDEYHARVLRTHEVKRSYDDLTRDYENKKKALERKEHFFLKCAPRLNESLFVECSSHQI